MLIVHVALFLYILYQHLKCSLQNRRNVLGISRPTEAKARRARSASHARGEEHEKLPPERMPLFKLFRPQTYHK